MVAFIHGQMDKFATLGGGRRSVEPEDLGPAQLQQGSLTSMERASVPAATHRQGI